MALAITPNRKQSLPSLLFSRMQQRDLRSGRMVESGCTASTATDMAGVAPLRHSGGCSAFHCVTDARLDAPRYFAKIPKGRTPDFVSGLGRPHRDDLQGGGMEARRELHGSCSRLDWMGEPAKSGPDESSRSAEDAMGIATQPQPDNRFKNQTA